jgi:hypothetical protein
MSAAIKGLVPCSFNPLLAQILFINIKNYIVMWNSTRSFKPLLIAGLAGAAYYAYTRMSDEQKKNLTDAVKKQGKEIFDGLFGKVKNATENKPAAEI